jgi:hypothetical protein
MHAAGMCRNLKNIPYLCDRLPSQNKLHTQICVVLSVASVSAGGSANGGRDEKMFDY